MTDWESFYRRFREPDFISGYEILHRLGGGAFGEVFKARKRSIAKPYAIKFLKLDDATEREAVERELEHVRLFASIDHPNLVTIEDMGLVEGVPYLIMGYAGEDTLARRMKAGDLGREEALRYFVQTCRGVLALHDRRLAHFDLKPGNVFLRGDVARVGDYGLAKLLAEGRQTLSFGRGTPHYMAPEMLRNRADHRADVYSLGVILFECVTGELPFDPGSGVAAILREDDEPPAFGPSFPPELRPVVERALRIDPDERYPSITELLEDLGHAPRAGDSVRVAAGREAVAARAAEGRLEPEAASAGGELLAAAAELTRGAVEVARGVLAGVGGAEARRARGAGEDVVDWKTLEQPDDGAALLAAGASGGGRTARTPPVPVPPRAEGGLAGTVVATLVLGVEVLLGLVTGPVVWFLQWIGRAVDRLHVSVHGILPRLLRISVWTFAMMVLGMICGFGLLFALRRG